MVLIIFLINLSNDNISTTILFVQNIYGYVFSSCTFIEKPLVGEMYQPRTPIIAYNYKIYLVDRRTF